MRIILLCIVLLASCKEAPARRSVVPSETPLEQARARVLLFDAALKHHQDVLHELEARDAGAAAIAEQRDKVEAVETSLHNEEQRIKGLEATSERGTR